MCTPTPYIEADLATLHAGIRAWSFGTLVTVGAQGVNVTHLPFLLDAQDGGHGLLTTHLSTKKKASSSSTRTAAKTTGAA